MYCFIYFYLFNQHQIFKRNSKEEEEVTGNGVNKESLGERMMGEAAKIHLM